MMERNFGEIFMIKKKNLIIFSSISFILFLLILINLNSLFITNLDKSISSLIQNNQNSFLFSLSETIHIIFEPAIIIPIIILCSIILWFKSKRKFSKQLFSTAIVSGILIYLLKYAVSRPRPLIQLIQETGFSFPSGHTLISIVLFSFLILFTIESTRKTYLKALVSIISVVMIVLVGFSRIYLNVHWFSDVIGSWLLGLTIVLVSRISFKD